MSKKRRVDERIELSRKDSLPQEKQTIPAETNGSSSGLPRKYTVSIAVPGSIVANAQSQELRTYLVGQLARAFVIFNIDEVVVFDDNLSPIDNNQTEETGNQLKGTFQASSSIQSPHLFLARILQYLETPQYLRKALFPIHKDLQFAGLLNPLDSPHHLRATEASRYREGIVMKKPIKAGQGSFVSCGLRKDVAIDKCLKPGTRVTVELNEGEWDAQQVKRAHLFGKVVSPRRPREAHGIYWGYQVRLATRGGYDLKIGTSERGKSIDTASSEIPQFNHLLLVLGGVQGIEAAVDADQSLDLSAEESSSLFDFWLNTCPNQGSRTIRTEEALLVTMSALRPTILAKGIL
ncbi:hypothetical protein DSO57_1038443 [Entomophthora muscae]|uniref:Uncharacterized protein n=2 Tax=Entomophthora muscae TaxID=34485 RepID=A0ACC2U8K8_9FUNG|nr:hypothetical protein DSO57_1038443 [Entomophthora muscae]